MWIAGVVLVSVACGLLVAYIKKKRELDSMLATETNTVEFLTKLSGEMTKDFQKGDFNYLTEVKGKIVCATPISSELAKIESVFYHMSVTRKYDETYYETDQSGNRTRRTRSGSETVSSNTRHVPFLIDDGTGQIRVRPDGAKFIAEKVMSRFEPVTGSSSSGILKLGSFSLQLPALTIGGDRRTTGYTLEEHAIRNGSDVFVLGEATDRNGELCLQKPTDDGKFIISVKGEETLLREGKSTLTRMMVGATVAALIGIVLLISELVKV